VTRAKKCTFAWGVKKAVPQWDWSQGGHKVSRVVSILLLQMCAVELVSGSSCLLMDVFWIDGGYGASLLRRGIVTNVWWVHKLKPILGEWVWARLHSIHYALRFSGQPLVQPSMKCVWHSEASRYGEGHWFGWSSRTLVVQGWKRSVRADWNEVHDPYTGSWADTIMLAVASVKLWVCAHGMRSLSDRLTELYILNLPGTCLRN